MGGDGRCIHHSQPPLRGMFRSAHHATSRQGMQTAHSTSTPRDCMIHQLAPTAAEQCNDQPLFSPTPRVCARSSSPTLKSVHAPSLQQRRTPVAAAPALLLPFTEPSSAGCECCCSGGPPSGSMLRLCQCCRCSDFAGIDWPSGRLN